MVFCPFLNLIWLFWGSGGVPLDSQHIGDSKSLILRPIRRIWVQFRSIFMIFRLFQKSCHGFLARYLPCFRLNRPKVGFSSFSVRTKKNRDEKLRTFVVVSPREVPSLAVSCPFKIFNFRSFLQVRSLFMFRQLEKSVH